MLQDGTSILTFPKKMTALTAPFFTKSIKKQRPASYHRALQSRYL
jgi:hypothetical protein